MRKYKILSKDLLLALILQSIMEIKGKCILHDRKTVCILLIFRNVFSTCFLVVISVSERQFFPARSEPCERCRIDIIDVLQFVTNKIEGVFANQILIIIFVIRILTI